MKTFGGPALFLDRADINTDEIIPAKYLTEITKEDLKLPGFDPKSVRTRTARVIVSRANFGCGSSREHAPWVFEVNEITAVIAESFARIFRQNMFNCGMLAIELPKEKIDALFGFSESPDTTIDFDLDRQSVIVKGGGKEEAFGFDVAPFDKALVLAGGWVDFVDSRY